ncbi:MAG: hypothetical protein VW103_10910 [Halieaceae bacterium]
MPDWLSIPRLVELILLGMAIEAIWLLWRHRRAGRAGVPPLLLHLISGALLLLAMKLALTGAAPLIVAAALGMAGVAHAADLRSTLREH